jgi:thiamine-monophosphate kinase
MARRPRNLSDVGETALIERIARRAGRAPGRDWALGIGDDAAVLRPRPGEEIVLSTDAVVEDVHFRLDRETPRVVGRRALVVNLSDLAAMGARPVGCLLSMALPRELPLSVFDALVAGVVEESERHSCPLVGGNLSAAGACSLTVTVVGATARGRALRRGQVRAGDRLFVRGVLGAGALARRRADLGGGRLRYVPTPRLKAGRALARLPATTGCLDLSDGLVPDLVHLLADTGLGAEIDAMSLPRPRGFDAACRRLGVDPLELLSTGGEDYELLFALRDRARGGAGRPRSGVAELSRRLGIEVREIGRVVARPGLQGLPAQAVAHHF